MKLKQQYRLKILRTRNDLKRKLQRCQKSPLQKQNIRLKRQIFASSQEKVLAGFKVTWPVSDIVKGLSLLSISRKAYRIVRENWQIPLPCERTLQKWLHQYRMTPGILRPVTQLLQDQTADLTQMQKICILSFDEMSICAQVDWDKTTDTIYGPHSKVQVLMASGICSKWRQPIFYGFDAKMSKNILLSIIEELGSRNVLVKAIVCDMGGTNQQLLRDLGISVNCTYFYHDFNKIHVFLDMPHLIKLMRNHLCDDGWLVNGVLINKSTLQDMISKDNGEIRVCPKLTYDSINLTGAERMRVAPAVQVFSNHTATLADMLYPEKPQIGNFFRELDDLFDIFNSRVPENNDKVIRSGFGLKIEQQELRLKTIYESVEKMRALDKKKFAKSCMLPCQRGILISVKSLQLLFKDLSDCYNVTYILTSRLNQDPLESLFSVIRALGRTYGIPSPSSFTSRLKIILFGSKLKAPVSSNVKFDESHVTFTSSRLLEIASEQAKSQPSSSCYSISAESSTVNDDEGHDDNFSEEAIQLLDLGGVHEEALHYLAGYIAFACKRKYKLALGDISRRCILSANDHRLGFIYKLSRGGLMVPTEMLFKNVKMCEISFLKHFSGKNIIGRPNITSTVCNKIKDENQQIIDKVILEFVKVRLKIRIIFMNASGNNRKKYQNLGRAGNVSIKNVKKSKQFIRSSK